jgi:AraC family transcriptional regulator
MKSALLGRIAEEKYMPGSSALGVSSLGLGWNGFEILEYLGDRGERAERLHERYILALWRGNVATGEQPNGRGGSIPYARYPDTITVIPPSIIPAHVAHNPYQVVLFFLEPGFVNGIVEELDRRPPEEPESRPNIDDPPTRELITLLAAEAGEGGPLGRLYADHLAHSAVIRILFSKSPEPRTRASAAALPRHLLGRVLERMHNLNVDLDLQTLAAETGYSRGHFLRMFHAATGRTPHRYLLQLRVQRAQELMRRGRASLIDIAASCGFSSHAHMSRVFRQVLAITPSEYRRSL